MRDFVQEFVDAMDRLALAIGGGEGWPLTGPQILPYFDADQALAVYERVMELNKEGVKPKEIAKMFQTPTNLRYYFTVSGVTGFKVANQIGLGNVSIEDRLKFMNIVFEGLSELVYSDVFCKDYKNQTYSEPEINSFCQNLVWLDVNDGNRRIINEFTVDLFAYAWSLYYNLFACAGFEIVGPYDVKIGNEEYVLVIRENFNMRPEGIWNIDPGMDKINLFLLFKKGTDYKLSYYNQPLTENHNENLLKVAVTVDGRLVSKVEMIKLYSQKLSLLANQSAKHINSLEPMEQVCKGSEISFFMLRDLFKGAKNQPDPKAMVDAVYEKFGDSFITERSGKFRNRMKEEWVRLFDPRNDYMDV